jgi:hypothetical protein
MYRSLEGGLVRQRERLAHLKQSLPDPIRQLGRALGIFDVLLDQLAPVGTQCRIDELDGVDAVQIRGALRLAHGVENDDDLLLPADHVQRRKLTQPCCRCLGVLQWVGRIFRLRC